eukprot:6469011-Pyramimonas_sp.AAC.1
MPSWRWTDWEARLSLRIGARTFGAQRRADVSCSPSCTSASCSPSGAASFREPRFSSFGRRLGAPPHADLGAIAALAGTDLSPSELSDVADAELSCEEEAELLKGQGG